MLRGTFRIPQQLKSSQMSFHHIKQQKHLWVRASMLGFISEQMMTDESEAMEVEMQTDR